LLSRRRLVFPLLAVAGISAPAAALSWYFWPPYHFAVVDPGVLYRSGQLGARDLARVHASTPFRTIVDLCGEKRDTCPALEEREFAREKGILHVNLPSSSEGIGDGENVRKFLEIVDDPRNRPVLVHCWKGIKRTGLMVAIYKMEYWGMD